MAHSPEIKSQARALYVFDRLDLTKISERLGVSPGTVRRWKSQAETEGDVWDKSRTAASMAASGTDDIVAMLIEDYVQLHLTVIEELKAATDIKPLQKAEALAGLADAFNKTINAAGRASPKISELAVAQDVIKRLGDFVTGRFPQHGEAFIEILEPFGKEVLSAYG
jgi:transposase-like protein